MGTNTFAQTAGDDLPILGIANVTFKVSDLAKARVYYQDVLGMLEAFELKDASGKTTSVYFKVNDDQFIEVVPTLRTVELVRQARVVFQSSDLEKLHAIYAARGLNPGKISTGPDGNPVFRIVDPEGSNLDFLQYVAGSQQGRVRGKFIGTDRVSTHLLHAGFMVKDRAAVTAFYYQKLGFVQGKLPGSRGDYIETSSADKNTETKYPPLDDTPSTHDQYVREQYGAVQHFSLEVSDMRAARDLVQKRGRYTDLQVRAHVGNSRHWLVHIFDPDGSRTELMETALQDSLPAMTVMAPGATAPPILPKTPGVLPWPSADMPATPPARQRPPAAARGGRYIEADPINFNDHAGWIQMFDGATLKGWDGPMDLWHVEGGNIVVQSKSNPPTGSTYLIWQGGEPKDFEFKFEVKLDGEGANSGAQFRATMLGEVPGNRMSKWETRGYQADIDNMNSNTGALIECCAGPRRGVPPRPDRAFRGQVVRTALGDGLKPTVLATFDSPDELKNIWKVGDWNQLHLIARGRTIMFFINGRLMSVLIDDHPTMFVDHGVLAIQLEGRGDNKASFRNLWLKNLP
jgi:catechol 2,3-dioxygenase-like lactoylglutathione lyase family enzyme